MSDLKKPSGRYQRSLKNFLINPAYQGKYIFWMTATGLMLIVMNAAVFYWFTRENYMVLVDLSPMNDEAKVQLYQELNQILIILGALSGTFLFLVSLMGLVMSHRTAGPMVQFKRVFADIREGKYSSRIRLRPKDDFMDVAAAFNEMMDRLESKVTRP